MRRGGLAGYAAAALLWLAVFSFLFTSGSEIGLWPDAADARLGRLDLPVGLAFGVALGVALSRRPRLERPEGPGA